MCCTYGQWLQMNATSSADAGWKSSRDTVRPSGSGRRKSGAGVPSGSIVEAVNMSVLSCPGRADGGGGRGGAGGVGVRGGGGGAGQGGGGAGAAARRAGTCASTQRLSVSGV